MQKLLQLLRSTLCAFVFVGSGSALAGQVLFYSSQPGDFIGQGQEVTITDAQAIFTATSPKPGIARVVLTTPDPSQLWALAITSADGSPLVPGSYEGAELVLTQIGHPGLGFVVADRTCDTVTGRFDVLEIVPSGFGGLLRLAVNFEQHCNGAAPALLGQIRVNSDIPITPPKAFITLENPNTRGCAEATGPGGGLVSVNANDATDANGGRSLAFNWSSTTGDVGTTPVFSFNAPLTADPQNPPVVSLSLTDLTNNTVRTATRSICVSDTTGPVIVINAPLPGQNVFGDSLILDVTIKDAVDKNITQYQVQVGSNYLSALNPTTGRSRQNILARPQAANGSVALTITVRATDASGNTSQRSVTVTQFP